MNRRILFVALVAAVLAAMPVAVAARSDHATLIGVHSIKIAARPTQGANCSNSATANNTFAYTGWEVAGPRTARLNTATVPNNLGNVLPSLQASFDAWINGSGAPKITVGTGSTVTKPTANHSYDLMWGRTGGSSIAVTYTWQWSTGEIESDTIFNNRLPWFVASSEGDGCYESVAAYDVANIATHEFGHTYGMDHPAGDRWETMYAYGYTGETLKRSLGTGDATGINALY